MRSSTTGRWQPFLGGDAAHAAQGLAVLFLGAVREVQRGTGRPPPAPVPAAPSRPGGRGPRVAMIFARAFHGRGVYRVGKFRRVTIPFAQRIAAAAAAQPERSFSHVRWSAGQAPGGLPPLKGEGKVTPEALDAALRQIRAGPARGRRPLPRGQALRRARQRARPRRGGAGEPDARPAGGQDRPRRARRAARRARATRAAPRRPPAVLMLCGLQGSGKTTTAGKLAKRLARRGKLSPARAGRPAARRGRRAARAGRHSGWVPVLRARSGREGAELGRAP